LGAGAVESRKRLDIIANTEEASTRDLLTGKFQQNHCLAPVGMFTVFPTTITRSEEYRKVELVTIKSPLNTLMKRDTNYFRNISVCENIFH
jgi:hypothetical protein